MVRTIFDSKIGTTWNYEQEEEEAVQQQRSSSKKHSRLASFLVAGFICLVSLPDLYDAKEVITNQFHVVIKRDTEHQNPREFADQVARDNGFHNLGPVSCYKTSFEKIREMTSSVNEGNMVGKWPPSSI